MRRNPYAPIIPCHRVVASDLDVGGFSGSWVSNTCIVHALVGMLYEIDHCTALGPCSTRYMTPASVKTKHGAFAFGIPTSPWVCYMQVAPVQSRDRHLCICLRCLRPTYRCLLGPLAMHMSPVHAIYPIRVHTATVTDCGVCMWSAGTVCSSLGMIIG